MGQPAVPFMGDDYLPILVLTFGVRGYRLGGAPGSRGEPRLLPPNCLELGNMFVDGQEESG